MANPWASGLTDASYRQSMLGQGAIAAHRDAAADRRAQALQSYDVAARRAGQQAIGAAMSVGRASPFLAARHGAQAASQAAGNVMAQRASAEGQMIRQDQMIEAQRQEAERNRARQMLGGIVGGAGQVLGTIMPAFAPAAGGAQALGGMISGGAPSAGTAPLGQPAQRQPADLAGTLGAVDQAMAGGPQMPPRLPGETEEAYMRRIGML